MYVESWIYTRPMDGMGCVFQNGGIAPICFDLSKRRQGWWGTMPGAVSVLVLKGWEVEINPDSGSLDASR